MKLGAQMFSVRTACQTPEDVYTTFKKLKEIGYEIVQVSGVCEMEAEKLKAYSEEFDLPITCTHMPYDKIINGTEALIEYHKTFGCPVIGLGSMPKEMRGTEEGVRAFLKEIAEPVKKIKAAGLSFTYHNHAFEFEKVGGKKIYDILIEESEMDFIHDVYWSTFAGADPAEYIELLGKENRMSNIHFKDMKEAPAGPICPCGEGVIDFTSLARLCKKYGIENIQVEQDNAPMLGDPFVQMKASFEHLNPIVHI